jgi:dihydrolipoamide dehydrogenase
MGDQSFDLVVIGGGPGGYVAAIRAAQLGMKTALIEREHLGGICLNWGCIPTKSLLRSAELYRLMKNAEKYGLSAAGIGYDLGQIVRRSREVSTKLQQGVAYLLKKNKVPIFEGVGVIEQPGRITVRKGDKITALVCRHTVVATGARPLPLKGMEPDGKLVWTYKEALMPEALPKRLLIVGAGAIGLEFASFYNPLGVDVTVVEALPQVLPASDEAISGLLRKELEKQGIKISTSTLLRGIDKSEKEVTAMLELNGTKKQVTIDCILLAVGVVGNVEGLGLENTKVKVERGAIQVNKWLQTDEPGIYAIGDVAGPPWLAHKASHEGIICVEKIAGTASINPLDRCRIPYCTFTYPQVASIGMTEKEARNTGRAIKVATFPFAANGKAIAMGETEGLMKIIMDVSSGELIGAHMIGAEVTEMIQGYGIAMSAESTEKELERTIFAHPTLSEMMHEVVLVALGHPLHV